MVYFSLLIEETKVQTGNGGLERIHQIVKGKRGNGKSRN
jgi:hypothetical protein